MLFEFKKAINSFESLERGLVKGVTSRKAVNVAAFKDTQGVVVPRRVEVSNFSPFVCSNVEDLALFALLVRIFRPSCINVVLCLILKFSVQVSKLVPCTRRFHRGKILKLILLLVQYPEVIEYHRAEIVLLFLATAHVDLVKHLNGRKFAGQLVNVRQADLDGLLRRQLMDIHMAVFFVPVVEPGLLRLQDVVRFKADDVLEEPAELVSLGGDADLGACILRDLDVVGLDGCIYLLGLFENLDERFSLLENG